MNEKTRKAMLKQIAKIAKLLDKADVILAKMEKTLEVKVEEVKEEVAE